MIDRKIIELINDHGMLQIAFVYCPHGKYRITNIPRLAKKNTVVEFSNGFWLQEMTVSLELYEFIYGRPYFQNSNHAENKSLMPLYGIDFGEIEDILVQLNRIAVSNSAPFVFDLPSIAEWEHALLSGKDETWSWGHDENEIGHYAWYKDNSNNEIHTSKQKRCNDWGLYDMYGNVYEYCYEALTDKDEVYFLNPKFEKPSTEEALFCMGGSFKSTITECNFLKPIGYNNQNIEPTGFRLIIRE